MSKLFKSAIFFYRPNEYDEVNMISGNLLKMGAKETIVRAKSPLNTNAYFKEKIFLIFTSSLTRKLLAKVRSQISLISLMPSLSNDLLEVGRLREFVVMILAVCQMPISDFRKKLGNVIVCAMERSSTDDSKR